MYDLLHLRPALCYPLRDMSAEPETYPADICPGMDWLFCCYWGEFDPVAVGIPVTMESMWLISSTNLLYLVKCLAIL